MRLSMHGSHNVSDRGRQAAAVLAVLFLVLPLGWAAPDARAGEIVVEPWQTVQDGIALASIGDHVVVKPKPNGGVYKENINFFGKNIVVRSLDPNDREIVAQTVIEGTGDGPVVTFMGTEQAGCRLEGLTIQGGDTTDYEAPTGGGIEAAGSRATIVKNVIRYNRANNGGAIRGSKGLIANNVILENLAFRGGAFAGCSGDIVNNTLIGNQANEGIAFRNCSGVIANNIIRSPNQIGAPQSIFHESSMPAYCCIQGWRGGGTGNFDAEPVFYKPARHDYRLRPASPCIDAGRQASTAVDFQGTARGYDGSPFREGDGSNYDVGADEWANDIMCKVTIETPGEGTTSPPPGTYEYPLGSVQSFGATPAKDWLFAGWFIGKDRVNMPLTINDDITVTAVFYQPSNGTLELHIEGEGSTMPLPPGVYTYPTGTKMWFTAKPADEWFFVGWVFKDKDGNELPIITDNPLEFVFGGEADLTARFKRLRRLTVENMGKGETEPPKGTHSYPIHAEVLLRPYPAEGWHFDHWEGDIQTEEPTPTVTLDEHMTVKCVFVPIPCTLTIAYSGHGSVEPQEGVHQYYWGDRVALAATPADGWKFLHWEGDLTSSDNPYLLTIKGDMFITASFVQVYDNTPTLVTAVQGNGDVDPSPGKHTYKLGESVTITAIPASGWRFDHWEGTDPISGHGGKNPITIKMHGRQTAIAVFTKAETECSGAVPEVPSGGGNWGVLTLTALALMATSVAHRARRTRMV